MGRSNQPADVFRFINTHENDPEPCWEWTGHLGGRDGRGYMTVNGKRQLAYRIVYEIFNGPIPDGQKVRHTCDNPKCCNPTHLVLGTQGDNEDDKYTHDRWGYTQDMVREMKRLNKLGFTYRAIAKAINEKYDCSISFSGVGKVIRGERRTKG